jgi:transposase-like protein
VKHWLWRAVDQSGIVLDVLVQRRRDKRAAKQLLSKLLKKQIRQQPVYVTAAELRASRSQRFHIWAEICGIG